ncbi:protein phosphatase 1H [Psammomys obesus]|uniref:protein phosphatase 1H n=1 Tax=Psammomys obesus TaxID=48139 RepID=UPI002452D17D|nr:protein phosphatase 1H [Psammomys obesus]
MLTRVKSAVANFMGGIMAGSSGSEHGGGGGGGGSDLPLRFPYGRPEFLGLSQDEVECSADHIARPILILKETRRLPWATGYAEVINAGKSTHNEDQASCEVLTVKKKVGAITSTPNRNSKRRSSLPNGEGLQLKENAESEGISCHYWSLFDGHAGSGAAVVASRLLQHHVTQQLQDLVEILKNSAILPPTCLGEEPEGTPAHGRTLTRAASLRGGVGGPGSPSTPPTRFFTEKKIPHECLVIGALESAFKEMDLQIERERSAYNISGGCTALIVLCLLGKLYVANAGDSRYTLAAQDLVMRARGVLKDRGWRISNDRLGSGDDISVYVIPLIHGNKLS